MWAVGAAMSVSAGPSAHAQTLKLLHTFTNSPDGAESMSGLVRDKAGNFYGTTYLGGTGAPFDGAGTIFVMTKTGKVIVLYSFCPSEPCVDGSNPSEALVVDGLSNLYGTTTTGGDSDNGVVFELTGAGQYSVLYSFKGFSQGDGANPNYGSLLRDKQGNLFGTTPYGGTANAGTLWQLDTKGNETVLHSFTGGADGGTPLAGVISDTNGNLYGTASVGGSNAAGVLFQYAPSSKQFTVLHDFDSSSPDGTPYSGLVATGSISKKTFALYGTTFYGGTNGCGVVYKFENGAYSELYSLGAKTDGYGCNPTYGSLTLDATKTFLIGTTLFGGLSGDGVIYAVGIDGSTPSALYTFTGGADGARPYGSLVRVKHNLYGTTESFGASLWGTVYELILP